MLFGVMGASPDSTLLRLLTAQAQLTTIMFWKSLFKAALIGSGVMLFVGFSATQLGTRRGLKFIIAGSLLQAAMEIGFTSMVVETSVARALLFYSKFTILLIF